MPGLLCILAHPDDEIFCAELLWRLSRQGIPLHLVCLTRGEGAKNLGDPPRANRSNLGEVREQEMRCSAAVLGVDRVSFLDYEDPSSAEGHQAPDCEFEEVVKAIGRLIERENPEVVLTHGSSGEYGHPGHLWAHNVIKRAVREIAPPAPDLYTFSAYHPGLEERNTLNRYDWADLRLQTSSDSWPKRAVLLSHYTQWKAFVGECAHTAEYVRAIAEHVTSLPAETYCCQFGDGAGRLRQGPLSIWLGREPDSPAARVGNGMKDMLCEATHRVRMYVGTSLLTMRSILRGVWSRFVSADCRRSTGNHHR